MHEPQHQSYLCTPSPNHPFLHLQTSTLRQRYRPGFGPPGDTTPPPLVGAPGRRSYPPNRPSIGATPLAPPPPPPSTCSNVECLLRKLKLWLSRHALGEMSNISCRTSASSLDAHVSGRGRRRFSTGAPGTAEVAGQCGCAHPARRPQPLEARPLLPPGAISKFRKTT